ncbi:hypothetical protein LCGC14_2841400, partial [marine sediment metagenome]
DTPLLRMLFVDTIQVDGDSEFKAPFKRLEELIGEQGKDFVASLYKIWGGESKGISTTLLQRMNAKHAVVFRQGGKMTIMTEHEDEIRYSSRYDFGMLYPKRIQVAITSAGKPVQKIQSEAWIEHDDRRFYYGIQLAPPGRKLKKDYYNLWQGFSVEPKKGDWSLYRQHLGLLVKGVPDHLDYVISWLADCVQNPGTQAGVALSFKGRMGVGKSTAAKWFGALFGAHFMHLDSEHRLLGSFNAHLHHAIVILADEAVWAAGKQGLGALKRMITEDTLSIEPKGLDVIEVDNMIHMIVCSNEDWFVPRHFDERRFAIFEVSDKHQEDHEFFGAVKKQLFQEGGLAALLYDLLEWKLTRNLRRFPDTEESERQKTHTMSAKHEWWYEQLISGAPWLDAQELP